MRRDSGSEPEREPSSFNPEAVRRLFDRPEIAVVYLFGSTADGNSHHLSDVDLAYLGTDPEAEERVFDEIYEALQRELGEGAFDLVPLRAAPLHLQFAVATGGKPLLVRDAIQAETFGARAISHYLDFKRCRDEYFGTRA